MPIHIKGSGGMTQAPEIQVDSNGLVTAKSGSKETTLQLGSAHDPNFIPGNIKKGETVFGLLGEYAGVLLTTFTVKGNGKTYLTIPEEKLEGMNGVVAVDVTSPKKETGSDGVFTDGLYVARYLNETISGTVLHCYASGNGYYIPNVETNRLEAEVTLSKESSGDYRLEVGGSYQTLSTTTYTITVIGF